MGRIPRKGQLHLPNEAFLHDLRDSRPRPLRRGQSWRVGCDDGGQDRDYKQQ